MNAKMKAIIKAITKIFFDEEIGDSRRMGKGEE